MVRMFTWGSRCPGKGLRPDRFCSRLREGGSLREYPHLKIEMWGTRLRECTHLKIEMWGTLFVAT
jgi:hypothetical protein